MKGKVLLGQTLVWVMLVLGQLHGYKSCIQKERKALLELKKYMISRTVEWDRVSVLPTWTNDTKSNCCRWKGVNCNRTSRRVIGIATGKTKFEESSLVNLSLLHPFEEVRSLNLSWEYNQFNGFFDDLEGYNSLKRLRNLEILDLSSNQFNNSIFPFLNTATSLTTLFLRNNLMDGPFTTKELKNLANLEMLDLSHTGVTSFVSEFTHLKKLKALDLSSNDFSSSTQMSELKYLTNLEVLSLSLSSFRVPIPREESTRTQSQRKSFCRPTTPLCLGSLYKLKVLDLSSNQLNGNLPSTFSNLESLEYLSLLDNNFTGSFSLNPLTNLTKLKVFKLSSTSDMLQVETASTWQPKFKLSVAVLRFCGLKKLPSLLVYQKNLRLADLSNNRLSGNIPTWLLANNPELEVLQLQNNSFTIFQMPTIVHHLQVLDISGNNIGGLFPDNIGRAFPNLVHMNGSDNEFQGKFPSSMGEMKNISFLDLSYNNFSGKLPRRFLTGCISLEYLKLSHNRFSGHFLARETNFTSLRVLRINNNLITGKIGVGLLTSKKLSFLDMSNNYLTGSIPSWISNLSDISFLSVSNNFLEGTIPLSLPLMPYLSIIDLSRNLFSGALPSHVHNIVGTNFLLHNNNFTGSIPDTLLEGVQILDLRNNKLSGSIPQFVNTLDINFLLLKGNKLTGSIPRQLCDLRNIRILDLSDNRFSGFIPSCLYNLSFGQGGKESTGYYYATAILLGSFQLEFYKSTFLVEKLEVDYYTYQETDIKFAAKDRYDSYNGRSEFSDGILDYMYGMDLSNNELSGVIPPELGDLSKLRALNLSRNFLSSSIPPSFSNLKNIESLDLSYNMLHGSIPHQLNSLTSLAVFNVSHNNLSGIIPQGRQFNTFNENSYLGNPLLCGRPTNGSCEAKKSSEEANNGGEEEEENEADIDMLVFYYSTASAYVTALICIVVLMCFDCPWRRVWLRIVDAFIPLVKSILPSKVF